MQPPQFPFPQNSNPNRKRVFMDPDVIEIPPHHFSRSNKQPKNKQVVIHEVIDVEKEDDFADLMIIDEKVDTNSKGKAVKDNSHSYSQAKEDLAHDLIGHSESSAQELQNMIHLDSLNSDGVYDNGYEFIDAYPDEFMDYVSLQDQFDNMGIPPGVEAPVPWFLDTFTDTKKTANGSDSSNSTSQLHLDAAGPWLSNATHINKKPSSMSSSPIQVPMDSHSQASGVDLSFYWSLPQTAQSMKKPTASQYGGSNLNGPPYQSKKVLGASSSSTIYSSINQLHEGMLPHGVEASYWGDYPPFNVHNPAGTGNQFYPSYPAHVGGHNHPPIVGPALSWFKSKLKSPISSHANHSDLYEPFHDLHNPPEDDTARTPRNISEDDIQRKFQLFKRFDTVEDHSDHYYTSKGSSVKQPSKNWAKRIQEEWRILENDLPDNIFVRVYESRMDLLRAVIVGAEGTPYHDGLFFFDVFFPAGYPNVPPLVYYHSGGLRLNPNLYNCGKVCLSLLGTWHGNKNEKWLPGVSTMLQVLVSIQALILNQKPYFNEPGYERMRGSAEGEMRSQQYNENTFIFSLKTMVYTMRRPPKHFEDFVLGHFYNRAHDILVACKAYMDGAQVGCLVKGGVQDVDEGDKSCSMTFKASLPGCIDMLLKEFSLIGVKDCEKFQTLAKMGNNHVGNLPKAAI